MKRVVEKFMLTCIHCILSRNSDRIPQPLASVLHSKNIKKVVQAEFLIMKSSNNNNLIYVFLIKIGLISYTWLWSCNSADNNATTSTGATWISFLEVGH